jgi:hypothetical protein
VPCHRVIVSVMHGGARAKRRKSVTRSLPSSKAGISARRVRH